MIITKSIDLKTSLKWISKSVLIVLGYIGFVALLYSFNIVRVAIPILPVTLLGTAVAFYLGFKNNNAYDRMWEARKIWGSIVNNSRAWAIAVDGYVSDVFNNTKTPQELHGIKSVLINRHIGWLYQLRRQLLEVQTWEHAAQNNHEGREARMFKEDYGEGLYEEESAEVTLDKFISPEEYTFLQTKSNIATHLIAQQERDLLALRKHMVIDDFRHMEMTELLNLFYIDQGKSERIKKYPLPRQYAFSARLFTYIFILMVPFSLMPEVYNSVNNSTWAPILSIVLTALVTWVYYMMDNVGDYSENPFQGMANDIPMLSMSRMIEIDLLEILGEEDTPPPIKAKKGILM